MGMLGSILPPVGDGRRRRRRWFGLAVAYVGGSVVAAAALGGALAALALGVAGLGLDPFWERLAAVVLALLYVPRLLGSVPWPPLLQSTWQVPQRWLYERPRWATAILFGLGLGSGVSTRIVVPTYYLLLVWPFLMDDALASVAVWALYGFARSVPVLWQAARASAESPVSQGMRFNSVLVRNAGRMRFANALLLLCVAGATAVAWAAA